MRGLKFGLVSALLVAVLVAGLFYLTRQPDVLPDNTDGSGTGETLVIHCAAGAKNPMSELAIAYERAFGVKVELRYGGTGNLLGNLMLRPEGDGFLSADDKHMNLAKEKELVDERIKIAQQKPVLAVAAGNPKEISSVDDLLGGNIRFAVANPETAAIGVMTKDAFTQSGHWNALEKAAKVMKPTVTDLATDLQTGAVDAVVIWDSTVNMIKRAGFEAEIVALPELEERSSQISMGVLASTEQPTRMLHFARWISSPERGAPVFRKHGFDAEGGDKWAESPEIVFYSGSVNRPAIERALERFSKREGVRISTTYNGCGILCADMLDIAERARRGYDIRVPDVYYACDICFIEPVKDLFPEAIIMTETDIVIAVPKGNPKEILSLLDLTREGIRLGISHAEQATLGFMTQRLFRDVGLTEAVRPNVKVENPQADFLINHLSTGSLDAAIVYAVNVGEHIDRFDLIPIQHAGALAVQPFAKSADTPYRALAGRLLEALRDDAGRFEEVGFRWIGEQEPVPSSSFQFIDGPSQQRL